MSPQYQIELRRRLESIAHIEIAEVASVAVRELGLCPMICRLCKLQGCYRSGLIGGRTVQKRCGATTIGLIDCAVPAVLLPIADVELQQVSQSEFDGYQAIAKFYQDQWQQMDPLLVGVRRFQLDENPNIERVAIEGMLARFGKEKYGWIANMLGPATPIEMTLPADDVAALQLHMSGTNPLGIMPTQDYHLFAGVKASSRHLPRKRKD